MKALPYDDWKAAGYHVRKGEKATGRNAQGKATFTRDQVDDTPENTDFGPDIQGYADEL